MTLKTLILTAIIVITFYLGKKYIARLVQRIGHEKNITLSRIQYVNTVLILVWTMTSLIVLSIVIGIGYDDVGLFFGSMFAIIGVALFAQWSILSNITASIIVFFFFPYKVGDYVNIVDGENSVEGTIREITLFHVILIGSEDEKNIITYPNAMVFQKAVKIKPIIDSRFSGEKIMKSKLVVGSLEKCDLPDLKIQKLPIRIDTGAKTSSLHVDNLTPFVRDNKNWVRFDIHPDIHNVENIVSCESVVHDQRTVKSSNGTSEERYVIQTLFCLGSESWPIQITLTNRSDMSYLMLFGREGMGDKLLVDPSQEYLMGDVNG